MSNTNRQDCCQGSTHKCFSHLSNEPICSRLKDFIQESPESGNRNVMLPDRCSCCSTAVKKNSERVKKEIENFVHSFDGSASCSTQTNLNKKT
ncbi:hypothetical protein F4806DRAFT_475533 [Annulohypoxylon nitens]|nr:hypothetical protein F4806DRAFT_475533 [Annulohypoxylon nitens]